MTKTAKTLLDKIKQLIAHNGPISLAEYMHVCMADPQFGYYKSRESIGRKGDFITAPEVSQMFGELIGVWCIATWQALGKPSPFCLAELGPGKGTLIQDLLRAGKSNPEFIDAMQLVLVETSERLQQVQRSKIPHELIANEKVLWELDINQLPAIPAIFIANEFFDVVPFRQYVKRKSGWHEIGIGVSDDGNLQKLALANCLDILQLPENAEAEPEGAVFENSPARQAIVQTLADRISENSGAALIIDYGHLESGYGDTFQAMADHAYVDPLANPGMHDLTSHVDFEALENAAAASGIGHIHKTTQGDFLLQLGLLERAGSLGHGKAADAQHALRSQVERLAGSDQMGNLFKVMALSSTENPLPGFKREQDA